ncbi:tRNA wybutosine-synthesizing protein 2/3/4 [Acorus calamus]|uniref:tRNA wybutosine-synthesizing protein 2/3/4 n=1 Tax=Acorus calamus TaxID=4465 RepID=A0AAV9DUK7_ACOCL|nr:tRNA wybutosine-synthesizing protein 2/3/4 [Acorus calamus]
MEFERRKSAALAALTSSSPDKSPKGNVDEQIVPLIAAINASDSYFTTSSCSGRISILSQPPSDSSAGGGGGDVGKEKKKKKAGGGGWVFVSHDPADPGSVVEILFNSGGGESAGHDLVFRFEPLIVAVECVDAAAAQSLVSTAISCGFRDSGVTSMQRRVMVAIRCSIRMEVPLGEMGHVVVSPEYVRFLVDIANKKMELNKKRTDGLLQALLKKVISKRNKELLFSNKASDEVQSPSESTTIKIDNYQRGQGNCMAGSAGICSEDERTNSYCTSCIEDNFHSYDVKESSLDDKSHSNDVEVKYQYAEGTSMTRKPKSGASVIQLAISGQPIEKLFLWGQSACITHHKQILVFGGFGGLGRHARRSDTLMIDPKSGVVNLIDIEGPPSPRLGHTSSVVGEQVYVIGGRGDPKQIFNDVWVLNTAENKWKLIECSGQVFHPRHRHATAVVGSKIYVFGGLYDGVIYSCMHILDTQDSQWSQLFMFGGYDGEKVLADLHSFDTVTLSWKRVETLGRAPYGRFSHSMFVYNNYLCIVGGCPVRQQCQELFFLDLRHYVWKSVTIPSLSEVLCVRSSAVVVDHDLVIIGGGASCYAFGTKFNPPMRINMLSIVSEVNISSEKEYNNITQPLASLNNGNPGFPGLQNSASMTLEKKHQCNSSQSILLNHKFDSGNNSSAEGDAYQRSAKHFALRVERRYAKLVKDLLKKFEWLDLGRKVYLSNDRLHVFFPITNNFQSNFLVPNEVKTISSSDGRRLLESFIEKELAMNEVSSATGRDILLSCGGSVVLDDISCLRKVAKAPQAVLREVVWSLIKDKGMLPEMLEQLPTRWERLGDIVVLPVSSFGDPAWDLIGNELWPVVAESLGACRLARQGRILPTGTRDSTLDILVGDNGWVNHHENGIIYSFDATKCMFSSGNRSEKLRMGQLDCSDETIVDLFAGIGYFVLPFLVKAKAKLVYACEWNPHAIEALRRNVQANSVAERCIILEGDNRDTAPRGVADRVCLGLLPTSEASWCIAVRALRPEGGILHVHGNVNDSEEVAWSEYVNKTISGISRIEGIINMIVIIGKCRWNMSNE